MSALACSTTVLNENLMKNFLQSLREDNTQVNRVVQVMKLSSKTKKNLIYQYRDEFNRVLWITYVISYAAYGWLHNKSNSRLWRLMKIILFAKRTPSDTLRGSSKNYMSRAFADRRCLLICAPIVLARLWAISDRAKKAQTMANGYI